MRFPVTALTFPLLAIAATENVTWYEKRSPEPQLQALIPLAVGGLTLGALGTIGSAALGSAALGAAKQGSGPADCNCGRNFQSVACQGTLCECQNTASIACWAKEQGKCKIKLKLCPSGDGKAGAPTAMNSEYPPCAVGLPACATGKVCQKLDQTCRDVRAGLQGCIGLCIPKFSPQQGIGDWLWNAAKSSQPKGNGAENPNGGGFNWSSPPAGQNNGSPQAPAPAAAVPATPTCPAGFACPNPQEVCVVDPHNTQAQTRGPSFKCVPGLGTCGGFQSTQCAPGLLCVPDPRNVCSGPGCTGLCA